MKNHILSCLGSLAGAFTIIAAPTVWNFDNVTVNQLPATWVAAQTGQATSSAVWEVIADATAPSAGNVLSVTTSSSGSGTYNLCWTNSLSLDDVEISVKFKCIDGTDATAGLCWRVKDKDNYYSFRASPAEGNFRSYYVKGGTRTQIGTSALTLALNTWHTAKVVQNGTSMKIYLDDVLKIDVTDANITAAGGVGCWTKGINHTSFDDFTVTALGVSSVVPRQLHPVLSSGAERTGIQPVLLNGKSAGLNKGNTGAGIYINNGTFVKKTVRIDR